MTFVVIADEWRVPVHILLYPQAPLTGSPWVYSHESSSTAGCFDITTIYFCIDIFCTQLTMDRGICLVSNNLTCCGTLLCLGDVLFAGRKQNANPQYPDSEIKSSPTISNRNGGPTA